MFGFFKKEEEKAPIKMRRAANSGERCGTFHREMPDETGGVYVEIMDDNDYKIYISTYPVMPAYVNDPYDKWCRKVLKESYVFANMETARMYFRDRKNEMLFHLAKATQPGHIAL